MRRKMHQSSLDELSIIAGQRGVLTRSKKQLLLLS
jgi:hypothetical protein